MKCKHLAGCAAAIGVAVLAGCSKPKPQNANKDMQKQQTNLMDAMDKIAAEEEKKRKEAEKAPGLDEARKESPADARTDK
ncbi:MAG: hypothetical protein AB7G11_16955 [Phycisphaerales bacterium]